VSDPPAQSAAPPSADLRASLALGLAAFVVATGLSAARIGHGAPDFYVFWAAARHWQGPYDPAVIAHLLAKIHLTGVWPFAYPPTFLLFVWPFAQVPLEIAYPLWTGLCAGLFIFAASRLVRPTLATAALFIAPIVFFSAELGQTSLPVGAAMIGGFLALERRPALAGLLFAIAASVKPQAMLMAPLVLWGRWRTLAWMAGAGAAMVAASLVFGFHRWIEWPHALVAFRAIAPAADRTNPSALIDAPWWALLSAVFGLAFALRNRNLVGLVGGTFCATPYAHAYDLAPLAPVALAWLVKPRESGLGHALAGGAFVAGLVATPAASSTFFAWLAALQSPGLRRLVGRLRRRSSGQGLPA
jgi:hypothetical protein